MAELTVGGVIREILKADLTLPADEVIRIAKGRGLKAPDATLRMNVHNIRSELKKKAAKVVPAAARETAKPQPAAAPTPAPAAAPTDLSAILANVTLVNRVMGLCGGAENARQAADAVRACGGVEAFIQHLDLIATIRGAN